jgi:hypothetical protein
MKLFDNILKEIAALIKEFRGKLPASDIEGCIELCDQNEYGLAFENLCTQLYEYEISISQKQFEIIKDLTVRMKMNQEDVNLELIKELINPNKQG